MSRNSPAPQPRPNRTARLLAFQAVLIAGILGYVLSQGTGTAEAPPAQDGPSLDLLQRQPILGGEGPRYDIVVDLECPYCNQFLSTDAYADILQAAKEGRAQLNVTAAAILNERSLIKGGVYNCVAQLAGPAAALDILPDLKTPGGDTHEWYVRATSIGRQHVPAPDLDACLADGAAQESANTAMRAAGIRGVPTVYIDGVQTPWTQVGQN